MSNNSSKARKTYNNVLDIVVSGLVLTGIFVMSIRHISEPDPFWHIATGNYILSSLSIPRFDPFTFTMSHIPWTPTEWLSEVIFSLIFKVAGFPGLILFTSLAYISTFLILLLLVRTKKISPVIILSLLAVIGIDRLRHCHPRPQIFTYIFLAYFSFALDSFITGRSRRLWHIPLLMVLWVNLHAGALSGLALIATIVLAETIKKFAGSDTALDGPKIISLVSLLVMTFLAIFLNPNGYDLIPWVLKHPEVNKGVGNIEFFSMSFSNPAARSGLILICMLAAFMALSFRSLELRDILVAGVFLPPALMMQRASAEFFIVTFPAFATAISLGMRRLPRRIKWAPGKAISALIPLVVLAAMIARYLNSAPFVHSLGKDVDPKYYPLSAISFIKKSLKGPVFNDINLGGAFILETYPEHKAFWDTRFHSDEMYLDTIRKIEGDPVRFQEFLDNYGIEVGLLEKDSKELSRVMFPTDRWALLYWDDWANVFARRNGVNSKVISKLEYHFVDPAGIVSKDALQNPSVLASLKKEIDRVLRDGPLSSRALLALAQIEAKQGHLEEAIDRCIQAIDINPSNESAYNSLGTFLARKGDMKGAEKALRSAIEWNPGFAMSYTNLGILYAQQGQRNKAQRFLMKALSINPSLPEAHLYLGMVLLSMQNKAGALSHLSDTLRLDPHQEKAEDIQRLIRQIEGK